MPTDTFTRQYQDVFATEPIPTWPFNDRQRPFWVVWSPGHGEPKHRHLMCADARAEAQRLAEQYPGQQFIVLKSDSAYSIGQRIATHYN